MENTVYKIVTAAEWRAACQTGSYKGSLDDQRDGFIHLSTGAQVEGTAARHFSNQHGLLLVAFDVRSLGAQLIFESSRNGDLFPHLYGELPTTLAISEHLMTVEPDGVPRATARTV